MSDQPNHGATATQKPFRYWLDVKIRYKTVRTQLILEFHRAILPKEDKLWFRSLEELFPFAVVNIGAVTGWLMWKKRGPPTTMLAVGAALISGLYLTTASIGEEATFHRNLLRDDHVGYYLRRRYLSNLNRQPTEYFSRLDYHFEKLYRQPHQQPALDFLRTQLQ